MLKERGKPRKEPEHKKKAKAETQHACKITRKTKHLLMTQDLECVHVQHVLGCMVLDLVDRVLQKECIRRTNTVTCGLWMHCEYLNKDPSDDYV